MHLSYLLLYADSIDAATCLKDERVDLLSHDTRGGRKHSRDEDGTVAADTPVLDMSTCTLAVLQSTTDFICLHSVRRCSP